MSWLSEYLVDKISRLKKEEFTKAEVIKFINIYASDNELPSVESNGITVIPNSFKVIQNGIEHFIPKRQFQLLYYLIANKNRVLTKQRILNDVWGTEIIVVGTTVDVHICKLRNRFKLDNIHTNKCKGYTWEEK